MSANHNTSALSVQAELTAFYSDLARHSPDFGRLVEPVPAECEPGPAIAPDLDDWWADVRDRSEWWSDLATDTVSDDYGDEQFTDAPAFDDDAEPFEPFEHQVVNSFLRPRSRALAIDAEEEARLFGWAR